MFKVIIFAVLVAATKAGYLSPAASYAAPIAGASYAAPILRASPYAAAPFARAAPYAAASYASPILRTSPYAAAPLVRAAPYAAAPVAAVAGHYDAHPQYSFGYDVQDGLTGDSKNHYETRNGDVVQGSYSLTDPDGTRRTVEYVADWANGFNAVVRKEPLVVAAPAPIAAAPLHHTRAIYG